MATYKVDTGYTLKEIKAIVNRADPEELIYVRNEIGAAIYVLENLFKHVNQKINELGICDEVTELSPWMN